MKQRYLLIACSKYDDIKTHTFYTIEETEAVAKIENKNQWLTTIIDLQDIEWEREKEK